MWRKEISVEAMVNSIQVDCTDKRRLCLCGEKGSLTIFHLVDVAKDRSERIEGLFAERKLRC